MTEPSIKLIYLLAFATAIACTAIASMAYLKARNQDSFWIWLFAFIASGAVLVTALATD